MSRRLADTLALEVGARSLVLNPIEGLTREEIAQEMGCGTATVARHWSFARNWLEEAFAETPGL